MPCPSHGVLGTASPRPPMPVREPRMVSPATSRSGAASQSSVSGKHPPPVACRSFRHFEPSLQSPLHVSISLLVSYRSHVCMQPCHGHAWPFDLQSQAALLQGLACVHTMAKNTDQSS